MTTDLTDLALTRRALLGAGTAALASGASGAIPPVTVGAPVVWIDAKTGHRIIRLSGDEGGSKPYFYRNCFTPQGDLMVFSTEAGIATVDLETLKRRLVVADPKADLLFASRRTRKAYYSISDPGGGQLTDRPRTLFTVDLDSGRSTRIGRIDRGQIGAVNADETLLVGTVAYGDEPLQPGVADPRNRRLGQAEYAANGPDGKPLNVAKAKGVRMLQRWAARVPMELFVLDLRTGERRVIHEATDWLNHPQFSPTDPDQIIFSHEGPWHRVTRMWRIRTDGSGLTSLHQRTMNMEIWGHEFFSPDGSWVWYDLQTPRGQNFWLAGIELATGRRVWMRVERDHWSVHYNIAPDRVFFAGDGGDADMVAHALDGKWIVLFRPEPIVDGDEAIYDARLVTPQYCRSERIVDMSFHDYRLEPNLCFTPDGAGIVFASNMHGRDHLYRVDVARR